MVHNGIEYGLMQAYAEGFEIMDQAQEFALDLHQIASIRSSRRLRRASATLRAPQGARGAIRASSGAISTPARSVPVISSKWFTTASNTA